MKTLAIDIPEDILFELKIPKQRWGIELRKELHCNPIGKICCRSVMRSGWQA